MARWEVRDSERSVEVEAPNWMMAMGLALEGLGMSGLELSCLICDVQAGGVVRIYDPREDTALLVRPVQEAPQAAPQAALEQPAADDARPAPANRPQAVAPRSVQAVGPEACDLPDLQQEEPDLGPADEPSEAPGTRQPWPQLAMPAPSIAAGFAAEDLAFVRAPATPSAEAPAGLAELLFEATMDITAADGPQEAAELALEILLQHVQAESAAVLFAGINDVGLRFLATRGPSSQDLHQIEIPFDHGIAGFSHTRAADLIVHNAAEDPRHLGEIDARTGYQTGAMLVAALRDNEGDVHGCIELINPPERFWAWQLDATKMVARTLADFLGRRA